MHAVARFAAILGMVVFLCACGGSGGGGGNGDLAGGETSNPDAHPTPSEPAEPPSPLVCDGADGAACPAGYRCVADPAASCDPATGMACAGICVLGEPLPGCGGLEAEPCPDGYICADDPADDCAGPAADCSGVCRPAGQSACTDDAQCPVLDVQCTVCPDGTASCPQSRCVNGACSVEVKTCPALQTCGVDGLSCEPGFECVDDPSDDCAPERGDANCGGICMPGASPRDCGGASSVTCAPGFECVDDPNDMCVPENGADCPGVCQPLYGGECTRDEECPRLPVPCSICADGTLACARSFCDGGRCGLAFSACPVPPGCVTDADCGAGQVCAVNAMCDPATGASDCGGICVPVQPPPPSCDDAGTACPEGYICVERGENCEPDAAGNGCGKVCVPAPPPACDTTDDCAGADNCIACPDGSSACAHAECRDGVCITGDMPQCSGPAQCRTDAECGVMDGCSPCADGALACPKVECRNGACVGTYPACPAPETCGGIAGISCPPGYTCVDRPGDDCDPNQAADCSGVCQREDEPLKCAGIAGMPCPSGYECADLPDECDPANGGADCPGVCRPAPPPVCASDAECPALGRPCQMCADGTAACPRSFCDAGYCRVEIPSCAGEDPTVPG